MPIVYLITNTSNGKQYVGKTSQPIGARWRRHCNDAAARRGKTALGYAIRRHGPSVFLVEELEHRPTDEEALAAEIRWILEMGTFRPGGYNLTRGGEGTTGSRHTAKSKAAIGAAHRGKVVGAETRERMSFAKKGKPGHAHSEEWKRARSEAMLGHKVSPETCAAISAAKIGKPSPMKGKSFNLTPEQSAERSRIHKGQASAFKGRHHTDETKAKLSAARRGTKMPPRTEEYCAKIKAALTGVKHTEERKRNISEAHKARFARKREAAMLAEESNPTTRTD